jgi:predicted  nucleic acid-binding Zn-ribbon protein
MLCIVAILATISGCNNKRISELHVQQRAIENELSLWQSRLDEMNGRIKKAPKPGTQMPDGRIFNGFSRDFARERLTLRDKITSLQADLGRVQAELAELK